MNTAENNTKRKHPRNALAVAMGYGHPSLLSIGASYTNWIRATCFIGPAASARENGN
ncbi:MAG: hypothetical protein IPH85_12480 [Ignavibacteria bacterium]|nr:hypothetical protein [Ignavibacteria bacterium]